MYNQNINVRRTTSFCTIKQRLVVFLRKKIKKEEDVWRNI